MKVADTWPLQYFLACDSGLAARTVILSGLTDSDSDSGSGSESVSDKLR